MTIKVCMSNLSHTVTYRWNPDLSRPTLPLQFVTLTCYVRPGDSVPKNTRGVYKSKARFDAERPNLGCRAVLPQNQQNIPGGSFIFTNRCIYPQRHSRDVCDNTTPV